MAWRIEFDRAAERELGKLDPQIAKRILLFLHERVWGLGSNGTENQRKHELEFALLVCDC